MHKQFLVMVYKLPIITVLITMQVLYKSAACMCSQRLLVSYNSQILYELVTNHEVLIQKSDGLYIYVTRQYR